MLESGAREMTGAQTLVAMAVVVVLFGLLFLPSMLWPNQPPARATVEHPPGQVAHIGTACRVWVDTAGVIQERGC